MVAVASSVSRARGRRADRPTHGGGAGRVRRIDGRLEDVRPAGELVLGCREHLGDVDLAPLTAESVEDVVLLVLERPLPPLQQIVPGVGQRGVARRDRRLGGAELLFRFRVLGGVGGVVVGVGFPALGRDTASLPPTGRERLRVVVGGRRTGRVRGDLRLRRIGLLGLLGAQLLEQRADIGPTRLLGCSLRFRLRRRRRLCVLRRRRLRGGPGRGSEASEPRTAPTGERWKAPTRPGRTVPVRPTSRSPSSGGVGTSGVADGSSAMTRVAWVSARSTI